MLLGESPAFFTPGMLRHGVYYGVREGGAIVAAAGTHVLAERESVAAIGNVYTRRDRRGRGLGAQVSGAVVTELLGLGIRTIVLNVAESNAAAMRVYERLGFERYCEYREGICRAGDTTRITRQLAGLETRRRTGAPAPHSIRTIRA